MNYSRSVMDSLYSSLILDCAPEDNVTLRRSMVGPKGTKMARGCVRDLELEGSLLINSILSQDEACDVVSMLNVANELDGGFNLPSFYTSSQMGGKDPARRPRSPSLSPIPPSDAGARSALAYHLETTSTSLFNPLKKVGTELSEKSDSGPWDGPKTSGVGLLPKSLELSRICDGADDTKLMVPGDLLTDGGAVIDLEGKRKHDPICQGTAGASGGGTDEVLRDVESKEDDSDLSIGGSVAVGGRREGGEGDPEDGYNSGEDTVVVTDQRSDLDRVTAKLKEVDDLLTFLDGKSTNLATTVKGLEASLEFSQHEIDDLKKENQALKLKLEAVELEDRRTQLQVKAMDDKLDRIETITKKKNLLFEGIPEKEGKKEDVDKTISDLFDQLHVDNGINIEACYRVGPFNRSRSRPILVAFEKQAD